MTPAERLIHELGITKPSEIILEDIAFTLGVEVDYLPLDGCEARIMGNGLTGIVTVNSRSSNGRRRFSLGHELGHWQYHKNQVLFCHADDIGGNPLRARQQERDADRFAADLLMPRQIFDPILKSHGKVNFGTIRAMADEFETSLTATAIRVVESRIAHAVLVCHGQQGRKWFVRSPRVPQRWFPQDILDSETPAFDVLFGGKGDDRIPMLIPADAWFDRSEAKYYEIKEQSVRTGEDEILTLLTILDDRMLED
jgi:hypothetical protein